ncbi:hypothetical protein Palpr_2367 [Paludibacter propionicigenes WB4]|uniref:Uncharacterized protein n=1 Tax=Paludibacter propionicigenes (strain DSM 17365 / JCM 13257 / WB4) TaxID=694427 RepID=E4T706_PALPW|nr:hypothetical protein [Paludibacter propionicigenes]ADQ80500.1 hypothetical protein Palpr_2367 [Paludibacter propionicigenes WB4]
MKKTFFCLLALFYFGLPEVKSQTLNDIPIKDINVQYLQIVGRALNSGRAFDIEIDFGQATKIFSSKETRVKDENGKSVKFNSMIDALNLFCKNGYKFVTVYVNSSAERPIYYYLLEKTSK